MFRGGAGKGFLGSYLDGRKSLSAHLRDVKTVQRWLKYDKCNYFLSYICSAKKGKKVASLTFSRVQT